MMIDYCIRTTVNIVIYKPFDEDKNHLQLED